MNAKKAKAIRRAMKAELEKGTQIGWFAHPKAYTNVMDQPMLKYTFQYVTSGGKRLVKIAKRIYKQYGILPTAQPKPTKAIPSGTAE